MISRVAPPPAGWQRLGPLRQCVAVPDLPVPPHRIFHLALRGEWRAASETGIDYRRSTLGRSLEGQGFIHCSFADQVQTVADLVFHGRSDVVLLEIDPSRLRAEVRVENLEGGRQRFPHVYGPLPLQAVARATDVPLGVDGRLVLGALLGGG